MITLWILFLIIFAQSYFVLTFQLIEYNRKIQIFHQKTKMKEQLAYSIFFHISENIVDDFKCFTGCSLKIEELEGFECYATIKEVGENNYVIAITITEKKNSKNKTNYHGTVTINNAEINISALEQVDEAMF